MKFYFVINLNCCVMKNLFFSYWTTFAFVGMIYLLSGCQSYIGEESLALESGNVQTKAEELPYIEIDLSTLSRKDTAVFALYMEAQNRMDKFIDYQDGQYVLNAKSGAEMNISESLFLNFKRIMERTNDEIRGKCMIEIRPNVLKEVKLDSKMLLNAVQTNNEESGGGGAEGNKGDGGYVSHIE